MEPPKTYQAMFSRTSTRNATCWYCEAIRESHYLALVSPYLLRAPRLKTLTPFLSDVEQSAVENEKPMPHISAHNAVDCPTDPAVAQAALTTNTRLKAMHETARRRVEEKEDRKSLAESYKDGSVAPKGYGMDMGSAPWCPLYGRPLRHGAVVSE